MVQINYLKLKNALWVDGLTQRELANRVGLKEQVISNAFHGRINFSESEKNKIATALGRKRGELFENYD